MNTRTHIVDWFVPSHYSNRLWLIADLIHMKTFVHIFINQTISIFIHKRSVKMLYSKLEPFCSGFYVLNITHLSDWLANTPSNFTATHSTTKHIFKGSTCLISFHLFYISYQFNLQHSITFVSIHHQSSYASVTWISSVFDLLQWLIPLI